MGGTLGFAIAQLQPTFAFVGWPNPDSIRVKPNVARWMGETLGELDGGTLGFAALSSNLPLLS
jgi:hypothetical protein